MKKITTVIPELLVAKLIASRLKVVALSETDIHMLKNDIGDLMYYIAGTTKETSAFDFEIKINDSNNIVVVFKNIFTSIFYYTGRFIPYSVVEDLKHFELFNDNIHVFVLNNDGTVTHTIKDDQ